LSSTDTVVQSFDTVTSDTGYAIDTGTTVCTIEEVDEMSADGGSVCKMNTCTL